MTKNKAWIGVGMLQGHLTSTWWWSNHRRPFPVAWRPDEIDLALIEHLRNNTRAHQHSFINTASHYECVLLFFHLPSCHWILHLKHQGSYSGSVSCLTASDTVLMQSLFAFAVRCRQSCDAAGAIASAKELFTRLRTTSSLAHRHLRVHHRVAHRHLHVHHRVNQRHTNDCQKHAARTMRFARKYEVSLESYKALHVRCSLLARKFKADTVHQVERVLRSFIQHQYWI